MIVLLREEAVIHVTPDLLHLTVVAISASWSLLWTFRRDIWGDFTTAASPERPAVARIWHIPLGFTYKVVNSLVVNLGMISILLTWVKGTALDAIVELVRNLLRHEVELAEPALYFLCALGGLRF